MTLFTRDVRHVVEMIKGSPVWGEECHVCSKTVERYSEHGIPFCGVHLPRGQLSDPVSLRPPQGIRNIPRYTAGRKTEDVCRGL